MKKYISLLPIGILIVFLTTFAACKKDKTENPNTSSTIGTEGGIYSFGDAQLLFPENSLNREITINGTIEIFENLPNNITPASNLHRFQLSHPEAYNPHSADISITVDSTVEGLSLFHSSDGITWDNLKGISDGKTITSSIPHFSYFFSGTASYSIKLENNSPSEKNIILFQNNPNIGSSIIPVAWFSNMAQSQSQTTFDWREDYAFYWSQTWHLSAGVFISVAQSEQANLTTMNKITIENVNSNYLFTNKTSGSEQGKLFIYQNVSISDDKISVGISMSGSPIYARQAMPNVTTVFNVGTPKYFLATGNYNQGEVLDVNSLSNTQEISFPSGSYHANVVINADGSWTVNY